MRGLDDLVNYVKKRLSYVLAGLCADFAKLRVMSFGQRLPFLVADSPY